MDKFFILLDGQIDQYIKLQIEQQQEQQELTQKQILEKKSYFQKSNKKKSLLQIIPLKVSKNPNINYNQQHMLQFLQHSVSDANTFSQNFNSTLVQNNHKLQQQMLQQYQNQYKNQIYNIKKQDMQQNDAQNKNQDLSSEKIYSNLLRINSFFPGEALFQYNIQGSNFSSLSTYEVTSSQATLAYISKKKLLENIIPIFGEQEVIQNLEKRLFSAQCTSANATLLFLSNELIKQTLLKLEKPRKYLQKLQKQPESSQNQINPILSLYQEDNLQNTQSQLELLQQIQEESDKIKKEQKNFLKQRDNVFNPVNLKGGLRKGSFDDQGHNLYEKFVGEFSIKVKQNIF
ncbi:hypothetical protein PPERSA_04912 [Pseudocohnilembus persalinus]|uniref:Uncharacterized protein n=1 Tax=Pseudocohnilembus persalinus TaxID=266149 RepID=A0A0V0QJ71_PSEPJ|nr:hypothetical protein PPERSA_04912 [Pseudocohnilembus persalinus]|eukprot:KRX02290.1 hypothetical protein PPERSA_04912 [Pseudocohnilembus persalinus]